MTSLGTIIGRGVVASRPSAGTPGALYFATDVSGGQLQRDNGSTWDAVEGAGGGGSSTLASDTDVSISSPADGQALIYDGAHWVNKVPWVKQLDYAAATDLQSNTSLTSSTWTDVNTNQTFTVDDANSLVEIAVRGGMLVGEGTASIAVAARLVIDSAGTPINKQIGEANSFLLSSTTLYANPIAGGSVFLTGLSAASHTVKLQAWSGAAGNKMYLRASTKPDQEFLFIQVIEWK